MMPASSPCANVTALESRAANRHSSIVICVRVVVPRWVSWSSKPMAGCSASCGEFDSHPPSFLVTLLLPKVSKDVPQLRLEHYDSYLESNCRIQAQSLIKPYMFVIAQFVCLIAIGLTGPLFARNPILLTLELAGFALITWAAWTMRTTRMSVLPDVPRGARLVTERAIRICSSSHLFGVVAACACIGVRCADTAARWAVGRAVGCADVEADLRRSATDRNV